MKTFVTVVLFPALTITRRAVSAASCSATSRCDRPNIRYQGEGWYWCLTCGGRWKEGRAELHARLDQSLANGFSSVDWGRG